jgi:L-asparaginase
MTTTTSPDVFRRSGPVPIGEFYIERDADAEYVEQLADAGAVPVHLHGSRQSGKSSLLIRARDALEQRGFAVGFLDLSSLTDPRRTSAVELSQNIAGELARVLGTDPKAAHERGGSSLTAALQEICDSVGKPTILIFDEFDALSETLHEELHRTLRALNNSQRARTGSEAIKVSLCGVEPPLGYFGLSPSREGVEAVAGDQIWLDDFHLTDATAERLRAAFPGELGVPVEAARVILRYGGGYPQACSWLGNLVAREQFAFDEDFESRLEKHIAQIFDPVQLRSRPRAERRKIESETQWVRVIERYFVEKSAYAREALDLYGQVLQAFERRTAPVIYQHGNRSHELLRTSGLARYSHDDERLRLRCPLFREAFGHAWIAGVAQRFPALRGRSRAPAIDKRLLVIGTGGTIGMAENPEGTVAPGKSSPEWFRAIEELVAHVDFLPLLDLDSADVGPAEWTAIVGAIIRRQGQFDGVVVAHGTDTMAYTASAVAFALGEQLGFPVVFTGSQTTVDVPHGDAILNILRAALVATQDLPEVVVMFGERIFRATRTQKKDDRRFDAFESPGYPELGFVAEEVQIFSETLLKKTASPLLANVPRDFSSGILHVPLNPGSEAGFYEAALDAKDYEGSDLCRAIVIQSLGAGNIPTKNPAFNLTRLIRAARERNVPVILTSQYPVLPANYMRYSPIQAAIKAGAMPTGTMTISAVVTKLSWVLPQVDQAIRQGMLDVGARVARVGEMMGREYVGEGGITIVEGESWGGAATLRDDDA